MASDEFRRELQREAREWQTSELISAEQYQRLAEQYEFATIETAARDRFIMILLGLGSILIGIGAITFVAANWQALSQTVKAGLLFIAMLVCDLSGFGLMNRVGPSDRWRRLGQALLLLGALLLGANLALMGQIVHTSSTRYELCATWAIGVLAMAYGLRLPFLGMLALLILGIGYWSALWDMVWLQNSLLGVWTLQMMPLLAAVLFIPLAYRCQSPLLFALSAIAVNSSLMILILDVGRSLPYWLDALVLILPFALLWAYDDTLWPWLARQRRRLPWPLTNSRPDATPAFATPARVDDTEPPFQPVARGLMLLSLSLIYWVLSFRDAWLTSASRTLLESPLRWHNSGLVMLTLGLLAGWTVGAWVYLGWRQRRPWRLDALSNIILGFLGITAGLFWLTFATGPLPIFATTVMNILLAVLSLGMMREGLGSGTRAPFWWGLVMLTLQILSRVLEYETGLLVKSLVFVVCGIGFIVVGLWFEHYVRTLRVDTP
ncbi:DUF2157 domain-containing protein [Halomicronema sp. CCY15110]|uniref:DUF2157 domain-containing protein n=1 Tax=Halomicronema sp. CCY15110 TaxID=2767773 RepID=UPI00194DB03B|nr:DUF2157 domain-containing protein [Halomicronema sp. CCY15110]